MKAGWVRRPLGDVLMKTETTDPTLKPNKEFDYIDVSSVSNETLMIQETQRLNGKDAPSRARRRVKANDVLFATIRPTLRRIAIVPDEFDGQVCSTGYFVLRASAQLDSRFVFYFLQTEGFMSEMEKLQKGASYPAVTDGDIRAQGIPLPPLPEQQRIVAILDEAFAGIATAKANAEKNLRNARGLLDVRLSEIFLNESCDWKRKTLREVSLDFGRGKSKHRPRNDPKLYGGPYPFIQTGDVRGSDHLITEYSQSYSKAGLAQSKLWPKGTLCITIAANIAETGILDFDACFPDSVIGVVADPKQTSNTFLQYLLQSAKTQLKAKGKGSAQDNINLGTFENERFPFPNPATQSRICNELGSLAQSVRELESLYTRKLAALVELKQSLLQRAFAGQL
jgi:type I restriction enzyme S subunit